MKKSILFAFASLIAITISSCWKTIDAGTTLSISGIVIDSIINKPLNTGKIYLYGTENILTAIVGPPKDAPIDSTSTDKNGKFSLTFNADGNFIGYYLSVFDRKSYYKPEGLYYNPNFSSSVLNFDNKKAINNVVVNYRALNYTKLRLIINDNPLDTFHVHTNFIYEILVVGKKIDTTIYLRHLPTTPLAIDYYTFSQRDTAGLTAPGFVYGNWHQRIIHDTLKTNLADTIFINKTIQSTLDIKRTW